MDRQGAQVTGIASTTRELSQDSSPVAITRDLVSEIIDDDVPGLAAEVAYHTIFSIPALFVVLISFAAVIENATDIALANRLRDMVEDNAPTSTQDILMSLIDNAVGQVGGGTASIGLATALLIALWAGSNSVGALVKAFNRAYDAVEQRSFPRMKLFSVVLTVVMGLVVNLALALWVFGGQIGRWLADEFSMGSTFDRVWNLSRIPVGVLVIVMMLGILYYFGPTVKQKFRWVLPGAVFSTVVWGIAVVGFSTYLRVASPGSAYGALSGMIVFLFFLYLTSVIFLAGAEFNAVLARRFDSRYRESVEEGDVDVDNVEFRQLKEPATPGIPMSVGSLAVGAATTVGIVLAAVLGRRSE